MNLSVKTLSATALASALLLASQSPIQAEHVRYLSVKGHACHGSNTFNGIPRTDFNEVTSTMPAEAADYWSTFQSHSLGVSGPEGSERIADDTPLDSVVVTHLDQDTIDFYETALGELFDHEIIVPHHERNVPIHESPVPNDLIMTRMELPPAVPEVHKFVSVRNRLEPVTLDEWNEADGRIRLECNPDGTGWVRIRATGLVPNMIYTVWQMFAVTDNPFPVGLPFPIIAGAMGGVPNAVVANAEGKASFTRDLHYCPLEEENPLMYVSLYLHFDHSVYGTQPSPAVLGPIVNGSEQLCFTVADHLDSVRVEP